MKNPNLLRNSTSLLVACFLPVLSQAQFSGDFAPAMWTLNLATGSDASINSSSAPGMIVFTGNNSNAGLCCDLYDDYEITIPCGDNNSGTITFNWIFVQPDKEEFAYSINGVETFVTGTTASGVLSIPISAGDVFAFRITSDDDCCGSGSLTVSNFSYSDDDSTAPLADASVLSDLVTQCQIIPPYPTATDNCSGTITATTSTVFPITTIGTTAVTWIYDDGNGNTSSQNQNIIYTGDTSDPIPDITVLPDFVVECFANPVAPTATDNCSGMITATTATPFPISAMDTTTVTWIYDDGNGNIIYQDQNIIVTSDNTAPAPSVDSLPDLMAECSLTPEPPTATDYCSGTLFASTITPFPITTNGLTEILWTYDDGNGNVSSQVQNVYVNNPIVLSYTTYDALFGDDGGIDLTVSGAVNPITFDWDNDGTGDNDDPEDLVGLPSGAYHVLVSDSVGCMAEETIVVNSQLTTTENESKILIYPNPTDGLTNIYFDNTTDNQLVITSVSGQIISHENVLSKQYVVNLSEYDSGVYFITLMEDERIIAQERIIKH